METCRRSIAPGLLMMALLIITSAMSYGQLQTNDSIWVAVRVYDGGGKSYIPEYSGVISKAEFDQIISHTKTNGYFRLDSICWCESNGWVRLQDDKTESHTLGYSGTRFFRVEGITAITLLDEDFGEKIYSHIAGETNMTGKISEQMADVAAKKAPPIVSNSKPSPAPSPVSEVYRAQAIGSKSDPRAISTRSELVPDAKLVE